jgi:hypothetical protein
MKRLLFILLLLLNGICAYSQTFAYSFEGSLSTQIMEEFQTELRAIYGIQTIEVRIKPDSRKGELIFSLVEPVKKDESDISFSPADIKQLMLKYKLSPLDFRQIK